MEGKGTARGPKEAPGDRTTSNPVNRPSSFPGRFDGHAHHGTVYLWVERVGQAAGLGKVHPHALRHTCATRMYEETGDVRVVQQFLGHSDPATTARYTRVPRRRLEAAVATLNYAA